MTITDGTNTYTTNYEDVTGIPVVNGNIDFTIGGNAKSQADSQYLKIISVFVISEADYISLFNPIINNFSAKKYYTPTYALVGKSAIGELEVALDGAPEIIETADRGGVTVYFVKITMHEIIYGAA